MNKHIKIFCRFFKMNVASALEYRASFFTQILGMLLSNCSFIFFWWLTFSKTGGTVGGYKFEDIIFIWAVTSSGIGLSQILFANVSSLTDLIITGGLDTFLLQPCNILMNLLCCRTNLSSYGDFLYGIMIMVIFYHNSLNAWIWFLAGVLACALIFTAVCLFVNTLTFYLGDASLIGQFFIEFFTNFSTYPEKIYGRFVRAFMYSVIPAGIVVHLPLNLFHNMELKNLLFFILGTIIYCCFTVIFFYRGLKHYESGNVIASRL